MTDTPPMTQEGRGLVDMANDLWPRHAMQIEHHVLAIEAEAWRQGVEASARPTEAPHPGHSPHDDWWCECGSRVEDCDYLQENLQAARSTPAEALDTGHSPSCPARKGEPCDDSLCGANALRMLLEDIIAGKTNLVAASSPPVRIAGDGGPDTDLWTCSCGLTRPVTGSYGCADCGDGRPDSWERVR